MRPSLSDISDPRDLRNLSLSELKDLAKEIREEIIKVVSENGGHLGPSLGTVELILALHIVFNTPEDKIVYDVGHQTYAHKLITGRYGRFHTIRKVGGLSGYPKREESPYDVYDTGHACGSVSYALGLAKSFELKKENRHVVVVIGDGSLTGGLAFEGLNNVGESKTGLIVVVNDNSMSISESVGGISRYLTFLRLAPSYRSIKQTLEKTLNSMPSLGKRLTEWIRRFKGGIKYFLFPEAWFEALGFRYYGPVDGHDLDQLKRVLSEAKTLDGPVLIHVITEKGRGYFPAERNPEKFHGPGPFDPDTGKMVSNSPLPTWSKVFGQAITHFAEKNEKIMAITAAMADGTGLSFFKERFPDRFFDCGIAEQHAVAFAAGLAQGGAVPCVAIYSTFLQRAYDQILEEVCLQKQKVVFAIDRAGIVGEDGETHQGEFDISFLRAAPGLTIMAPKDERELVQMLYTAIKEIPGPSAIRYPRGVGPGVAYQCELDNPHALALGKAEVLSLGEDLNILSLGTLADVALSAKALLEERGVSCGVTNARFVKPMDEETIRMLGEKAPLLVLEENVREGGFGEGVIDFLSSRVPKAHKVDVLGIPSRFIEHGTRPEILRRLGLDAHGVYEKGLDVLGEGGQMN